MLLTIRRLWQAVLAVGAFSMFVLAQTGTSAIAGTVTDATGSAIPGVSITVINRDNGARLETLSNDTGAYRVASFEGPAWTCVRGLAVGILREAPASREEVTCPCPVVESSRRFPPKRIGSFCSIREIFGGMCGMRMRRSDL